MRVHSFPPAAVGLPPFIDMTNKRAAAPPPADELDMLLAGFEPLPAELLRGSGDGVSDSSKGNQPRQARRTAQGVQPPGIDAFRPASSVICARQRRARYRDRSRNELLYLREVVAELEHDLHRWQRQVATARAHGRTSGVSMAPSIQAKLWRTLAYRQRHERRLAEAENARLRVLLDNQLRFAAQFTNFAGDVVRNRSALSTQRAKIDEADVSIFDAYLDELDVIYAQTDAVMRDTGLAFEPAVPHRSFAMRSTDASASAERYIEILDTLVLPSPLAVARQNTWQNAIAQYLQRSGTVYSPSDLPQGASTIKYKYPHKWCGRESIVSITHVVRIYDEVDRQVVVYRVLTIGEGGLAGIATDEMGWSVLSKALSLGEDRTLYRSVTRVRPMRLPALARFNSGEAAVSPPPSLMAFVKLVFSVADVDFGEMQKHLQALSHATDSVGTPPTAVAS